MRRALALVAACLGALLAAPGNAPADFKLTSPDADDRFGWSVAMEGDVAVVGQPLTDRMVFVDGGFVLVPQAGTAHIFTHAPGSSSWILAAALHASDPDVARRFGTSVAIDDGTVVVGAPDPISPADDAAAYVFEEPAGSWDPPGFPPVLTETARLTGPNTPTGGDGALGSSVAIDGDTVVAGAPINNNAQLYLEPGGGWSGIMTETATLDSPTDYTAEFGRGIAVSGGTVAVGNAGYGVGDPGAVHVFEEPGGGWTGSVGASALLQPAPPALGDEELMGTSVAMEGDTIVAGAPAEDEPGYATVYQKPGGGWSGTLTESARLTASGGAPFENEFGHGVDISGETIVAGAPKASTAPAVFSGAGYVYYRPGSSWAGQMTEAGSFTGSDVDGGERVGYSVGVSGDAAIAGAPTETDGPNVNGAAYGFFFPAAPSVDSVSPVGPANDNAPLVSGTAVGGSTVSLFTNPLCTSLAAGSGAASAFASPGIAATVPDDATTTIYGKATTGDGPSRCSATSVSYSEDSTPPPVPDVTNTTPGSPAEDNNPRVLGTAEPGSTVTVYGDSICGGAPLVTGTAEDFGSSGLEVTVPDNSTTSFSATASDPVGNESACSVTSATYTELTPAPPSQADGSGDAEGPGAGKEPGAGVTCAGREATIIGTPGADRLRGTRGPDVIAALGGDDRVGGLRGDDLVCGGSGGDRLRGGWGEDELRGGAGTDRLMGRRGADLLLGGSGLDFIAGGPGQDRPGG